MAKSTHVASDAAKSMVSSTYGFCLRWHAREPMEESARGDTNTSLQCFTFPWHLQQPFKAYKVPAPRKAAQMVAASLNPS